MVRGLISPRQWMPYVGAGPKRLVYALMAAAALAGLAANCGRKPGTGTKFRKGSEIRASPRFAWSRKLTSTIRAS
jgi:hypothetical protein